MAIKDERDKLQQEVEGLRQEMNTMRVDIEKSRDLTHEQRIRALDLKYELQAVSIVRCIEGLFNMLTKVYIFANENICY